MDSLTHVVIGATVGELFFEKGFGKKAMFWGALAQSIPDIDFMSFFWMSTPSAMMAHRGFTHSVFGAILFVSFFSLLSNAIHRPHNIRFLKWLLFFSIQLFLHLLLDAMNNYGIGWLEPFSHQRFSFNIMYVADPFFSLAPAIAFVYLILKNRYHLKRKTVAIGSLMIAFIYLNYCIFHKIKINQLVKDQLKREHSEYTDYFTTPTPFQNWLWWIVVKENDKYRCGYHSLFDNSASIQFIDIKIDPSIENNFHQDPDFQTLKRFSQGFYRMQYCGDTAVFNDLRFGQSFGWRNPHNDFVLHYHLKNINNNQMMIQRGRFSGWDFYEMKIYIRRIVGFQDSRLK